MEYKKREVIKKSSKNVQFLEFAFSVSVFSIFFALSALCAFNHQPIDSLMS